MKHLLLTTIAAVMLVGCGESQPTDKAPDISIHEAARDGHIEAVKQHLAAGADVNAKDKSTSKRGLGWTPLHYATTKEIADIIRKHGGKTGEELKAKTK